MPGVIGVVLGGSRATGEARPDSDWDIGLLYRSSVEPIEPAGIRALGYGGEVVERGAWGPIVDGGAWLEVDGLRVDLGYRDLDRIDHWIAEARAGRFTVHLQNGYVVGAPSYIPMGELAVGKALWGDVPEVEAYPEPLRESARHWWRATARTALLFADVHGAAGDPVALVGMLAHAALAAGHAVLAGRGEWVLNEKRLLARAGLTGLAPLIATGNRDEVRVALDLGPYGSQD